MLHKIINVCESFQTSDFSCRWKLKSPEKHFLLYHLYVTMYSVFEKLLSLPTWPLIHFVTLDTSIACVTRVCGESSFTVYFCTNRHFWGLRCHLTIKLSLHRQARLNAMQWPISNVTIFLFQWCYKFLIGWDAMCVCHKKTFVTLRP